MIVYLAEINGDQLAFLDRALADRWVEAAGGELDVLEVVTSEPPLKRTWFACVAVESASVHIPTGERSVEIVRRPRPVVLWGDGEPGEHLSGTPEEAVAHCLACATCDAVAR